MLFKLTLRLFVPFMLISLIARATFAQDVGSPYIVIGDQTINARDCPRLTCSVLQSLAPDTTISVLDMVDGDTVYGSDQWAKFEDDGVEMFVHSGLIEPTVEIVVPSVDEPASAGVDTDNWLRFEAPHFEVLAPRGWMDVADIVTNEDLFTGIADMYGQSQVDWLTALHQACLDKVYDLVLIELGGSGTIYIEHEEWGTEDVSLRYLQSLLETQAVVYRDAEVISSEVITVPAGQAVRLVTTFTNENQTSSTGNVLYGVVVDEAVYYLTIAMYGDYMDYYIPIFDTIVNSFDFDPSDI